MNSLLMNQVAEKEPDYKGRVPDNFPFKKF
jgi:hypothetical protein